MPSTVILISSLSVVNMVTVNLVEESVTLLTGNKRERKISEIAVSFEIWKLKH